MTITHIDNVYQVTASGLGIVPGIWVRLLNNSTAINYYSTAVTDPTGAFTHSAPPGDYALYTGTAATVPGTPTLRNAHYSVPVTAGDDVAANSYTASSSPYAPSAAAGAVQVTLYAPAPSGGDDSVVIQDLINTQQTHAKTAEIVFGPGTWQVNNLIPAPGTRGGGFTDSTRPLFIRGLGMYTSFLQVNVSNAFIFLYAGYSSQPKNAQMIMSDLCLDGNYSGVAGGAYAQPPSAAAPLIGLNSPFTASSSPNVETGPRHNYSRVRFYRPTGYVFQGAYSVRCEGCFFDQVGQPDKTSLNYDNVGSGGDDVCEIVGCHWSGSRGNYVDFAAGTSGHSSTLIFVGNRSIGHIQGGLYGCGVGSVIVGNQLSNVNTGSGVGYDATTHVANRSKNVVANNVFTNLSVNQSSLSAAIYGDLVYGNSSREDPIGPSVPLGQLPFFQGNLQFGISQQTIAYAATITPDLSQGQIITVGTLTGAITVNNPTNLLTTGLGNVAGGQIVIFNFTQDATGHRRVSWGANYKGAGQPVLNASAQSYMIFLTDSNSKLWCLSPAAIDGSGRVYGPDNGAGGYAGLQLAQAASNGDIFSPSLTTDGTSMILEAAAASFFFRPTDTTNKNGMSGGTSGLWQTYDGSAVARNILDDGSGQMVVAGNLRRARQTPTEAVLVSGVSPTSGENIGVTITAARVVGAPLSPVTGQHLIFTFIQGGAGAFAITWNAVFKKVWSDTGNATGARSSIEFCYDGTNWNQVGAQAPYV